MPVAGRRGTTHVGGREMAGNSLVVIGFGLLALIGCGGEVPAAAPVRALPSATTLPAPTLTASEDPVIRIYEVHSDRPKAPRDPVEVAVWSDGRIAWRGKDSQQQARID